MTDVADALDRLPPDARARLDGFAKALERVHVDDLPLYTNRRHQPAHRRALEAAALVARTDGLDESVEAARRALIDGILREYAGALYWVSWGGMNPPPGLGPTDDRVRVLRSLGEAVMAIVLWERLDAVDQTELLGLWARLLP